ncbi:MAG: biotin/lipoyl-containing protein [Dehalococcoidia bacterium]
MPTEIVMPQMGAEMEEGTVLKWLKQPGDTVNKGDIIAEIETDKATVELDSFESGTFLRAVVDEGTTVPVGQVIGYLGEPGEQAPDTLAPAPAAEATPRTNGAAPLPADDRAIEAERAIVTAGSTSETLRAERTQSAVMAQSEQPEGQPAEQETPAAQPGPSSARDSLRRDGVRLRVSPVARSMADELGVDLALIRGTGPEGRITRRDVEEFARNRAAYQVQGVEARAPVAPEAAPARRPVAQQVQVVAPTAAPTAPAPASKTTWARVSRSRHGQAGIRSVSSVQTLLRPAVAIASQPAFWNRVVVGIDDQMLHVLLSLGYKRLSERQRRAALGETDLDHHTSVLCGKSLGTTRASLSGPPCDRIDGLSTAHDVPCCRARDSKHRAVNRPITARPNDGSAFAPA